nr:hypothetical protein [Polynucleobacter necessarius]
MGPETILIPMQNGIPWWYFQKLGGEYQDHSVETVDAGGVAKNAINPNNIIGCVVYPATFTQAPGVIRHVERNRFPLGELDGKTTERIQKMSEMMGLLDLSLLFWTTSALKFGSSFGAIGLSTQSAH